MVAMLLEMKAIGPFKFVRFHRLAKLRQHTLRLVQRKTPDVYFARRQRQRFRRFGPCLNVSHFRKELKPESRSRTKTGRGDKKNTFICEAVQDRIGPAQIQWGSPPN